MKNLAYSLVATAPSPATSGTSLVVTASEGSRFESTRDFYTTLCPPNVIPTIANSEIIKVTARSTDTFTIVRAQRGSSAMSVAIGWQVFEGIYVEDLSLDGWIDTREDWAYASANTITVPTGALARYAVGDRIKWTQTTVKYGVLIAVADTLLTILINTDYVVTNAAISANYYSHESSPVGYPDWFNMPTPTFNVAYYDDGAGGQPTTSIHRASVKGRTINFYYKGNGLKAGTDVYMFFISTMTVPTAIGSLWPASIGIAFASGPEVVGPAVIANPGTTILGVAPANITDNTAIALRISAEYEF